MPKVELHCGDIREVLPNLDCKVDAIITDPPYNIGSPQRITDTRNDKNRKIGQDFGTFDTDAISPREWLPLVRKNLKKMGILVSFYGARNMHNLLSAAIECWFEVVQDFHWCKTNPPVPMRSGFFLGH